MRRVLCWLGLHRWAFVCGDAGRHHALVGLCTRAGLYERCERCGKVWDDLGHEAREHFRVQGVIP